MAPDNYQGGLRGETVGYDVYSPDYQAGASERERRARGPMGGGAVGGAGGAGGGAGIVLAAVLVIIAFCAFVVSFCVYPVAGLAVLIAFAVGSSILDPGGTMNFVGLVFAMMLPCLIVYMFVRRLEARLGARPRYRAFRHYWRLFFGTMLFHAIGASFHMEKHYPDGAPLSAYALDAFLTFTGFFFVYWNSLRLDRDAGLKPVRIQWIDRLLVLIKNRLVPPAPEGITETGVLPAQTENGSAVEVSIQGGAVLVGAQRIPLDAIVEVAQIRQRRGLLGCSGVLLLIVAPLLVKGIFGDFSGTLAKWLGFGAILYAAWLFFVAVFERTPAGRLGGPFRSLRATWNDNGGERRSITLRFTDPRDERLFTTVVDNLRRAGALPAHIIPS